MLSMILLRANGSGRNKTEWRDRYSQRLLPSGGIAVEINDPGSLALGRLRGPRFGSTAGSCAGWGIDHSISRESPRLAPCWRGRRDPRREASKRLAPYMRLLRRPDPDEPAAHLAHVAHGLPSKSDKDLPGSLGGAGRTAPLRSTTRTPGSRSAVCVARR